MRPVGDSRRVSMTLSVREARIVDALVELGYVSPTGPPGTRAREAFGWAVDRLMRDDLELTVEIGDAILTLEQRRREWREAAARMRADKPRSRDEVRQSMRILPGGRA